MVGLEGGGMCIEVGVWFVRLDDNLGKLVEVWNSSCGCVTELRVRKTLF
jgi:hypothetical protein